MNTMYLPAAPEVREAFEQEVVSLGGVVTGVVAEGDLLFARAVLPRSDAVRPDDYVHGGVAVRTHDTEILVHPYTYRVVCANGAISAHTTASRAVERVDLAAPTVAIEAVLEEVRSAVRECAAPAVLDTTMSKMREATQREADVMLQLMPVLPHLPPGIRGSVLRTIVRRFESEGDRSAFGLMNALTSVARDTPDPDTRWRLEELGGGMLARLPQRPKPMAPEIDAVGAAYAPAEITPAAR